MKAFIFSLDAFVAFTLALIAIYTLIFFSSIPSSYYYTLTQAHLLARDSLVALATTDCMGDYGAYGRCDVTGSVLDNIVSGDPSDGRELVKRTVGEMVPEQFGYSVEMSGDEGGTWTTVYNTLSSTDADEAHAGSGKKLSVSSQTITFGYSATVLKEEESIYHYRTCGGPWLITCANPNEASEEQMVPEVAIKLVRITIFI